MSRDDLLRERRERLRLRTGEELAAYAATLEPIEDRGDHPPRLGELYFFAETAELPVEWAVIEQDPREETRLLVVPADLNPSVGSADVEVPAGTSTGALTLRCRFGVWLEASDFDPDMCSGRLQPTYLAQAQERRRRAVAGAPSDPPLDREVDGEPEYEQWVEDVLREAQAALSARVSRRHGMLAAASEVPSSRLWSRFASPYGLAAAVLLSVGLTLGGGAVWHFRKLEEVESRLQAERLHEQEMESRFQAERLHEKQLEAVLNLPYVWLVEETETVRGDIEKVRLPAGTGLLHLILEHRNSEPYPRYKLEILRRGTDEEVWSNSELSRMGTAKVSVGLPPSLLGAGEHTLRLYGLGEGLPELVAEYAIRVELE